MICNIRHGYGIQIWDDNAKYEGEWKYDKACGYGTFYHVDGDIYKGKFVIYIYIFKLYPEF